MSFVSSTLSKSSDVGSLVGCGFFSHFQRKESNSKINLKQHLFEKTKFKFREPTLWPQKENLF